jgi:hypothetical protein
VSIRLYFLNIDAEVPLVGTSKKFIKKSIDHGSRCLSLQTENGFYTGGGRVDLCGGGRCFFEKIKSKTKPADDLEMMMRWGPWGW